MTDLELSNRLSSGAPDVFRLLYRDVPAHTRRWTSALAAFGERYGAGRQVRLFSVPGRTEICGNHTDHNRGRVLAGAVDRDIIAVASPRDDGVIRLKSEGFEEDVVDTRRIDDPGCYEKYSSRALIAGICRAVRDRGVTIGGFDAYTTTEVLKGAGISSSAAFEVMVAHILNRLYGGALTPADLAKAAQYAENVYFGKPCGLMDQMACAVGGMIEIDFGDPASPVVSPIGFSLSDAGYRVCLVNTGGNHADLNEDYASVPAEMKAVARALGRDVLRGLTEEEIRAHAAGLREKTGDRALLRALHFVRENERVDAVARALRSGDVEAFLAGVSASGRSSFEYLQNVYTVKNVAEQGLSLCLCLTEGLLAGKGAAWRVHGGGFAGTVQVFLKDEDAPAYAEAIDRVFGAGAVMPLSLRPVGAVEIEP